MWRLKSSLPWACDTSLPRSPRSSGLGTPPPSPGCQHCRQPSKLNICTAKLSQTGAVHNSISLHKNRRSVYALAAVTVAQCRAKSHAQAAVSLQQRPLSRAAARGLHLQSHCACMPPVSGSGAWDAISGATPRRLYPPAKLCSSCYGRNTTTRQQCSTP